MLAAHVVLTVSTVLAVFSVAILVSLARGEATLG
jgi:hypothetical protein